MIDSADHPILMDRIIHLICKAEKIALSSIQKMTGGQINSVYLLNDSLILRLAHGEANRNRLANETRLLQSLKGVTPIPQVVAAGQIESTGYQIQHLVPGIPLHQAWSRLATRNKESIAIQLAGFMHDLHTLTGAGFGPVGLPPHHGSSWAVYLENKILRSSARLRLMPAVFPSSILDMVEQRLEEDRDVLEAATPVLVHRDLWPGNILVYEGQISAILDFEFTTWAPCDYELLLIEQFCLYPNDYAEEGHEIYACADFADFFYLLKKHALDLFSVPHLRKRLDLYHLEYSLSAYLHWLAQVGEADNLALQPVAKVMNFLFEHGTRMFNA